MRLMKCVGREKIIVKFAQPNAVVAQMVEHQLPKLRVVGSIPIYRSNRMHLIAPDCLINKGTPEFLFLGDCAKKSE